MANLLGITSVLGAEAKIYYDTLFTTTHMGRVSDLISAALRNPKLNELQLRASLLELMFETYRRLGPQPIEGVDAGVRPLTRLTSPFTIECGAFKDRVAIGISFFAEAEFFKNLTVQLKAGKFEQTGDSSFDGCLRRLSQVTTSVLIRGYGAPSIVEIIALIDLNSELGGLLSSIQTGGGITTEWFEAAASGSTKPKEYVQLADLAYDVLLAPDEFKKAVRPLKLGEVTVKRAIEEHEIVRVGGTAEGEATAKISGEAGTSVVQVVQGSGEKEKKGWRKLFGRGEQAAPPVGAGSPTAPSSDAIAAYESTISSLQAKIQELEAQRPEISENSGGEDEQSIIQKLLKKLFSMGKGEQKAVPADAAAPTTELLVSADGDMSGLEQTLQRAAAAAAELDGKDPKAKRIVDNLMTEVVQEKGRLQELSKRVNLSIRQKELEFKTKSQTMQEEIRKRDESLRQKDFALTRAKEQIKQLSGTLDRSRNEMKVSADEGVAKAKIAHVQKLLAASKEDARGMSIKLEDYRKQVASLQLAARNKGGSGPEFSALQAKFEKGNRQLDEFKRANQQLVDRLNRLEERAHVQNQTTGDESKKRLEAAMRQLTVTKREGERLASKVAEMQREDMRLRGEVVRLNTELKRAKSAGGHQDQLSAAQAGVRALVDQKPVGTPAEAPGKKTKAAS